jgi:hypothetical protein
LTILWHKLEPFEQKINLLEQMAVGGEEITWGAKAKGQMAYSGYRT